MKVTDAVRGKKDGSQEVQKENSFFSTFTLSRARVSPPHPPPRVYVISERAVRLTDMSNGVYGEDLAKVGVTRKSQSTNVLLVHSELGKVS